MAAYYNEFDPFAAGWLRELIRAGQIAAGDVDERSITDVSADDVRGYTQCHFFAGIGGWSLALRLAGWPDDRSVWTGSCPCQPFSRAGKSGGGADPRHLWPAWHRLIRECRPPVLFGEQVEAAVGHGWLDLVCDDLEGDGYAVGAVGLPAAGVGAPHIRQRLWFVADSTREGRQPWEHGPDLSRATGPSDNLARSGYAGLWVADATGERRQPEPDVRGSVTAGDRTTERRSEFGPLSGSLGMAESESAERERSGAAWSGRSGFTDDGELGDTDDSGPQGWIEHRDGPGECAVGASGLANAWADLVWLSCRDGKARATQPGLFPLAHGIPARVGRLRGYGNAIVPQAAAAFIGAYLDI